MISGNYIYGHGNVGKENNYAPVVNEELLEQVYAWDTGSNDILAACTKNVSELITDKLFMPFSSNVHPDQRTVDLFQISVREIIDNLEKQDETHWTDSEEIAIWEGGDDVNLRSNLAHAALWHFHWVASVFLDVPRASVLIR